MRAAKCKVIVAALLALGASLGWAASYFLWRAHLVDGCDDPRMLLVVLGSVNIAAVCAAWRHRELVPRLVVYPSTLAVLTWLLRPLMDGRIPYPREFRFLGHHPDFYPSFVVPAAIVGGIVAVAFTRLSANAQDPKSAANSAREDQ